MNLRARISRLEGKRGDPLEQLSEAQKNALIVALEVVADGIDLSDSLARNDMSVGAYEAALASVTQEMVERIVEWARGDKTNGWKRF
jgi:hypothetical protein